MQDQQWWNDMGYGPEYKTGIGVEDGDGWGEEVDGTEEEVDDYRNNTIAIIIHKPKE